MSAENNTQEKAFKDNKRQRGQKNAQHVGQRQKRIKKHEFEGRREKLIGNRAANKPHDHGEDSKKNT